MNLVGWRYLPRIYRIASIAFLSDFAFFIATNRRCFVAVTHFYSVLLALIGSLKLGIRTGFLGYFFILEVE